MGHERTLSSLLRETRIGRVFLSSLQFNVLRCEVWNVVVWGCEGSQTAGRTETVRSQKRNCWCDSAAPSSTLDPFCSGLMMRDNNFPLCSVSTGARIFCDFLLKSFKITFLVQEVIHPLEERRAMCTYFMFITFQQFVFYFVQYLILGIFAMLRHHKHCIILHCMKTVQFIYSWIYRWALWLKFSQVQEI
jgi:hypothetical protein